jgi:hypothetical protein
MHRIWLICAAVVAAPLSAQAQLAVKDAWVRASVPQQDTTGAFMTLRSAEAVRVVGVRSPVAGMSELHETRIEQGVAKMLPVTAIEIPAGGSAELKPGGYHVMLMGLKQQVKEGESVPLTVLYEGKDGKRHSLEVKAPVRPITGAAPAMQMEHMHHSQED